MKKTIMGFILFSFFVSILGNISYAFVPSSAEADTEYKTIVYLTKATSKKPISVHLEIKNTGKSSIELANFVFTFKNLTDKSHFWGITSIFRYTNSPLQLNKNKKISITIPLSDFKFINTDGAYLLLEQVKDIIEKQNDDWFVSVSMPSFEEFELNHYSSLDSDFPRNFQFEEE
jgi:hypothetical protein